MERRFFQGGELRDDDLQMLSDNIPGGMFACRFDEPLTLLQINNGFLSMLGYTREEIRLRFHDSFWNMIDPRDQAPTMREVQKQMALGPDKVLEYRMRRKDGSVIWVLDKGRLIRDADGTAYFFCVLVDVTRNKEIEEDLRLSLERHQIIMDQTTDVLFEWDLRKDTIIFSGNWEKKFGCAPPSGTAQEIIASPPHVYEEDHTVFTDLMERIRSGEKYCEAELRLMDAAESTIWCRFRITGLSDKAGRTIRAVGAIVDVDADRRKAQHLMERAQRDALTGLYNKRACQERIEMALSQAERGDMSALLIIDLDNFKRTNDTMGHLFGDALLTAVAHVLQAQFRSQDVVGRIGGDEFLIFLDKITDDSLPERKAARTMVALQEMAARELGEVELFCSIGIALAPDCGRTYSQLFQAADMALYQAKSRGKNQFYRFYPEQSPAGFPVQARSALGAEIDSDDHTRPARERLFEDVFRILYQAVDFEGAVNAILELAGRQFDVSRVYIFEEEEDPRFCNNTFEWCGEGVEPQKDRLQHLACVDGPLGDLAAYFNENGVFYCRDISVLGSEQVALLESQGIKSMLQCAIYAGDCIQGLVGFDECRTNRFWTQEQIDALTFIAQILSTFLLKYRAQNATAQNARAMEEILDGQNSWIYLVRPGTFALRYMNRRTQEWVPHARPGVTCHEAFFHRSTPCEDCPVRALEQGDNQCVRQIYNPFLKVWTSASARRIHWKGEEGFLLTCHDITELKTEVERLRKELGQAERPC